MKRFFYSGAFDPFTAIDAEIVCKTAEDNLVVIGLDLDCEDPCLFSVTKRMEMIKQSIEWYAKANYHNHYEKLTKNIEVISYRGLPIYEAKKHNSTHFLIPALDMDNVTYDTKYTLSKQIARNILSYQIGLYLYNVDYLPTKATQSIKLCYKNHEYIALAYFVTPPAHNMMMEDLLESEYFDCCKQTGISWPDFCQKMSTRAYHNLSHIAYMLNLYRLRESTDFLKDKTFKTAVFFHDYVLESAEKSFEASKLPESAKDLFMATKCSDMLPENLNADERLIHDLDLAIFIDKILYENYAKSIRSESANIATFDYATDRSKILEDLSKEISKITFFTELQKEKAYKNIDRELEYLKYGFWPDW